MGAVGPLECESGANLSRGPSSLVLSASHGRSHSEDGAFCRGFGIKGELQSV